MSRIAFRPAFAILVALGSVLAACSHRETGPDRTVRRFFRAMNEKDVTQMLSCFDPRQERMFKASFRLAEKVTGFPVADFFELVPGLHQAFGASIHDDFRFSHVRIRSRDITGTTALVRVSVKSTVRVHGIESSRVDDVEFTLARFEEGGWRIVAIRPERRES